jgi:hypothetical protein
MTEGVGQRDHRGTNSRSSWVGVARQGNEGRFHVVIAVLGGHRKERISREITKLIGARLRSANRWTGIMEALTKV